jgi:hypothetical protein
LAFPIIEERILFEFKAGWMEIGKKKNLKSIDERIKSFLNEFRMVLDPKQKNIDICFGLREPEDKMYSITILSTICS